VSHARWAVVGAEDAGVHELGRFRAKDLLVARIYFCALEVGGLMKLPHVESGVEGTLPAGKA